LGIEASQERHSAIFLSNSSRTLFLFTSLLYALVGVLCDRPPLPISSNFPPHYAKRPNRHPHLADATFSCSSIRYLTFSLWLMYLLFIECSSAFTFQAFLSSFLHLLSVNEVYVVQDLGRADGRGLRVFGVGFHRHDLNAPELVVGRW